MLKRFASEALGLSDIGKIISPSDFDKVDADDYIFHEDNEKIYFLIKSKKDEYCFTNRALLHVDGESAISSKRTLKRYEYSLNRVKNVLLETAGTVDLDVEIKFVIGGCDFSIDVDKQQLEQLKDLYKALFEISRAQTLNADKLEDAIKSLTIASSSIGRLSTGGTASDEFEQITQFAFQYMGVAKENFVREDFSEMFDKYINN
ncbi:PH domain-containing protein [Photobacterium japonica]|uniref:PH domain-containing protein n=1 Tax=Photobacterium japonica TaxID=2910235 RepID=UPI003D105027